uniref:Uncharacterized protein n=1 Tax=Ceratitis capitata TaxID=7213 RepID=W8BJW8_CERCA
MLARMVVIVVVMVIVVVRVVTVVVMPSQAAIMPGANDSAVELYIKWALMTISLFLAIVCICVCACLDTQVKLQFNVVADSQLGICCSYAAVYLRSKTYENDVLIKCYDEVADEAENVADKTNYSEYELL